MGFGRATDDHTGAVWPPSPGRWAGPGVPRRGGREATLVDAEGRWTRSLALAPGSSTSDVVECLPPRAPAKGSREAPRSRCAREEPFVLMHVLGAPVEDGLASPDDGAERNVGEPGLLHHFPAGCRSICLAWFEPAARRRPDGVSTPGFDIVKEEDTVGGSSRTTRAATRTVNCGPVIISTLAHRSLTGKGLLPAGPALSF
jgi:hypothetical protein